MSGPPWGCRHLPQCDALGEYRGRRTWQALPLTLPSPPKRGKGSRLPRALDGLGAQASPSGASQGQARRSTSDTAAKSTMAMSESRIIALKASSVFQYEVDDR